MPTSAVYQPTTVTYEQQPADQRWNCPMSYFTRRIANSWNRAICIQLGLFVGGITLFIIGASLMIVGGTKYAEDTNPDPNVVKGGIAELIAGSVLLCLGIIAGLLGISALAWRWGHGKEAPSSGAAALTALNPSTDPLVAAQYAPVRDAPPAPDDEMRNLMDNKDCLSSAEESDKMLDGRPSVA